MRGSPNAADVGGEVVHGGAKGHYNDGIIFTT